MKYEQHVEMPVTPQPAHIHRPDDGKGPRRVYVDGEQVRNVVYADTQRGLVHYHLSPVRLNRRKTGVRWAKKVGRVEIVHIPRYTYLHHDVLTWLRLQMRRTKLLLTGWHYDGGGRWSKA